MDMDGVLAEWKTAPKDAPIAPWLEEGYYFNLKPNQAILEATKRLSEVEEITTTQGIKCKFRLGILSCYPLDSKTSLSDKHQWLNKYFPQVDSRLFVPFDENRSGENKLEAVGLHTPRENELNPQVSPELSQARLCSFHLLFEDYTKNLLDWQDHGGLGIKVLNGINDRHKTWTGPRVNINSDTLYEDMLNTIIESVSREMELRFGLSAKDDISMSPKTYEFYQMKSDPKYRGYKFEDLDTKYSDTPSIREKIRIDDYDKVYEGVLNDGNIQNALEDLYEKFNLNIPPDFKGHSMSVSDVVVVNDGKKKTSYFVSRFGFTKFPEFTQSNKDMDMKKGGLESI